MDVRAAFSTLARRLRIGPSSGSSLALGAGFAAVAVACGTLDYQPDGVPALWAPVAVALAVLMHRPRRDWPFDLASVLLASLIYHLATSPWRVGAGLILADLVGLASALIVLHLFRVRHLRLDRARDALIFVGPVAGASAALSGFVAAMAATGQFQIPDASGAWRIWSFSYGLGLLALAPALLAWRHPLRQWHAQFKGIRSLEFLAVLALLVALQTHAVSFRSLLPEDRYALLYLPYVPLLWIAVRFGAGGAGIAVFALTLAGIGGGFASGVWPYDAASAAYAFPLETALGVGAAMAIAIAAVTAERQRTQRALERSETRYRRLTDRTVDLISHHGTDTVFTDATPAVTRLLGYAPAEILGRRLVDLVEPADAAEVGSAFRSLGAGIDHATVLYRARHRDGHLVWLETVARGDGGVAEGREPGAVAVSRDGSQRQRSDAEFRDALALLHHSHRLAQLGPWIWIPTRWPWAVDAGQKRFSEDAARILGLVPAAFVSSFPEFLEASVHPADRHRVHAAFHDLVDRAVDGFPIEYRILWPGSEERWVNEMAAIQRDADGAPECIVGALQDITERKRNEAELQNAKEQAELANRTKSEFLANMSHELRTPLNAVIGFAEIMIHQPFGPLGNARYRDYVHDIAESGRHLLQVINEILDISRIEAGRGQLREETVDLAALALSCQRLAHERATSAGLNLSVQWQPDLPAYRADTTKMKQMLINLLSNAIKFTPEGGRIDLSVSRNVSGELMMEVRDTGVGMRPEDIPIALAPFRQVDGSHVRRHEGTGLGLPLSKSFAELHGGRLVILSELGKGTMVRIILPASRFIESPGSGASAESRVQA